MKVQDIVGALEGNEYAVKYYGPSVHVFPMSFEEDPCSKIRFIIRDDGGEDPDYGCMEVQFHDFGNIRFDWYDGEWKTNEEEIRKLLEDDLLRSALSNRFSEIAIEIGPNARRRDDAEVWKKIISRCRVGNDSLIDELDVMMDYENGNSSHPAKFRPFERKWWDTYDVGK